MRVRRLPSCRIMLVLLGGVALVIILFATSGASGRSADPVPRPTTPAAPATTASATTASAPSAAVAVATSFTRAFLSAGQVADRVRGSLATPALVASLTASPGAPAGNAQLQALGAQHVRAVAATIDDQAPGAVGVSTTATVQFGSSEHAAVISEYLDLLVVSTPAGWKVSRIDL
jgi:hypothetical protein